MRKRNRLTNTARIFITFLLVAACALAPLTGCVSKMGANDESGEAGGLKPGAYTASANGMGGNIKVEVTVSENEIVSVTVLEHSETAGISDPAIKTIPEAIVDSQSVAVDSVTGATITSAAIVAAVTNCLIQAGAVIDEWQTPAERAESEDILIETGVVVVGGGIAGLSAAIEAADNGAKVVLVEKMAAVGGASTLSGGEVLAAGTAMQAADGIEDSWETLADYWVMKGEGHLNETMVRGIAEMAPENILWMMDNGVKFMETMQTPTSMPWADPKRTHLAENGSGSGLTMPLAASAEAKGVTILTDTPATGLIVEDGTVIGIEGVTATGGKLTVMANSVILATGGYENNAELMQEYSPLITVVSAVGEAHVGDGLIWARELGSPIIAGGGGIVLAINYNTIVGPNYDYDPYGIYLYVDGEGSRFMDESEYWFSRSRKMLDLPEQMYYSVMDSKATETGAKLDAAVEAGAGFSAGSIEELAELMGCDPEVFAATVEAYNKACAEGNDAEFGKAADKLITIDQAPFYALVNTLNSNSGSFGGPKINNNCQVIGQDGNPIPGLYAAGEVANGEIFYKEYPCSGSAIQSYMAMGRIAGKDAALAEENKSAETVSETADVLVVGGGLAGLSAAISAAENGADVILIEKLSNLGGSSAYSGGGIGAAGSSVQADNDIEDSAESWKSLWEDRQAQSLEENSNYPDWDRVDWLIEQGPELIDWMVSQGVVYPAPSGYGVDTVERLHFVAPIDGIGSGAGLIRYLTIAAENKGVRIMLETKATELIQTNGVITGAIVETAAGTGEILAGAVVLTTGGFAQNPELMSRFIPDAPYMTSSASPGTTGDGIIMAENIGAALYEDAWIIGLYTGVAPRSPLSYLPYSANLYVAPDGKRVVDEASHYAILTNAAISSGGVLYMIYDSSNEQTAALIEANLGEYAFVGDTFAELAQAAGIEEEAFVNTMQNYNAYAQNGLDEDFGKNPEMLIELNAAPYYAVRVVPNNMGTFGGVKTNVTGEVLDNQGDVIPGLYAAGECANRAFYNQIYMSGSALAVAATTGKSAGQSAAEFVK